MKKIKTAFDLPNGKIVEDGHMITQSLILIDLFSPPDPDSIVVEDIAHGLANTCRWNGHTQKFFSVAQHCCMMYDLAPFFSSNKLNYLLHDAEEAYWGDIIKPLKNIIQKKNPEIIELMTVWRHVIYKKFGCPYPPKDIKSLDSTMLIWEFENIIKSVIKAKDVDFWLPEKAKTEWLDRFYKEYLKS